MICQSSPEIAGSPRNLWQEDSHPAPERDSTGSDRSRTASGASVGGRVLGAKVQDRTGKNPSRWGRFLSVGSVMARRPSVSPPSSGGRGGTIAGWAWKQPSPKECVTAQRCGVGPSSLRGSKPTTDPSCFRPSEAVAVRSPQGRGEMSMLTRVAATVAITVVRCPRVPPGGFSAEGHSVPHTCAWRGGLSGNEHPRGPYPKPTPVGWPSRPGPRANHSEGTRQIGSLLSAEGASLTRPGGEEMARNRGSRLFTKNTGLGEHSGGRIGSEACPVPAGERVSPTPKPRSTTAVTLTVLR